MTVTLLGPLPDGVVGAVSWLANALTLLCIVPLCWATWRHNYSDPKRAHPKPVTWGVWFVVGSVATVGMALGGAPASAWLLKLCLSLGPAVVAAVALYKGERLIVTRVDRWSLWLCALGIVVYVPLYFGWIGPADPVAAGLVVVGMAILVDVIAAGPTYHEAWRSPEPVAEIVTFGLALVSVLAVLCILPTPWTWLGSTYLVFLAFQMGSIIAVLWLGRRRVPRAAVQPEITQAG